MYIILCMLYVCGRGENMQDAEVEELDGVIFLIGLSDNYTVKKI